jgi:NAD kinase
MRAAVIYKESLFELYGASLDESVRRYALESKESVSLRESHQANKETLEKVLMALEENSIGYDCYPRSKKPDFKDYGLVMAVGGDGTFIDVGHYLEGIPIMGVNSDPVRSRGIFCCYDKESFGEAIADVAAEPRTQIPRLEVSVNGRPIEEKVMNETLLYHKDRGNFRFLIEEDGQIKRVTSSYDVFISTPMGSSGSIYNFGSAVMPLDSSAMVYYITGNKERIGEFRKAGHLEIESLTREGMMRIDGEHIKYSFTLGDRLSFRYGIPLAVIGDIKANRDHKGFS